MAMQPSECNILGNYTYTMRPDHREAREAPAGRVKRLLKDGEAFRCTLLVSASRTRKLASRATIANV